MVVRLVLSRLDSGNSILVGLPGSLVRRLQSVLNAPARLVCNLCRYVSVTDVLADLHWLRIQERVKHKFAVLTNEVLHGVTRAYLGPRH